MVVTGVRTHRDYVRFTMGHQKWYQAVLAEGGPGFPVRLSRKRFRRAEHASRYRRLVQLRLARLRAIEEVVDELAG